MSILIFVTPKGISLRDFVSFESLHIKIGPRGLWAGVRYKVYVHMEKINVIFHPFAQKAPVEGFAPKLAHHCDPIPSVCQKCFQFFRSKSFGSSATLVVDREVICCCLSIFCEITRLPMLYYTVLKLVAEICFLPL